ncbi:MAG: DEAD/DEAH box helicase, partial [Actinomycetota bacterium]
MDHLAGPAPSGARAVKLDVLLPSSRDAPLGSPRLLRDEAVEVPPPSGVAPWTVSAAALSAQDTLNLLLGLPLGDRNGARLGDSVWFFAEVAKLALELVARGRVVPALVQQGERWAAQWQPAPATAADAARLESLVTAMPAACRAVHKGRVGLAGRPAPAVLHDSLTSFADACARGAIERRTLVRRRGRRTKPPPLHEVWRGALASGEPWVKGDPYELELLQKTLDDWAYPIREPSDREFRTCFRLSEPASVGPQMAEVGSQQTKSPGETEAPWRLEILLQGTGDPSLLVPAEDLWAIDGPLNAFRHSIEDPHELVLEDLGRALRLYPGLEPALRTPMPTCMDLDAGGAHEFLAGAAASLEQAGFGVLVPPWWGKREAALGLKLSLSYKGEAEVANQPLLGMDGLCNYRWKVAIGNVELTLAELKRLAQAKWPLVKVRGRWVELRPEDLEAALALFKRGAHKGEMALGDAMRTGLGLAETPGGLPVMSIAATGRLKELFAAGGDSQVTALATPGGFEGELRPYQERGLGWLFFLDRLGLGACLADDMGLGKTAQLLALLVAERKPKPKARIGPTLVVCPMSVVGNWQREANRFAPGLEVHVHHGKRLKGRAFAQAVRAADLVLTTYATATRDKEMLGTVRWERVVIDEAQNIKTSATNQAQAIRSLQSRSRVALTGTPIENRLSELWSIMEFLNPGLLGSAKAFKQNFAVPIERYRDEVAEDTLGRVTGPFLLRRLKTDKAIIKDLPDKIEMKVFCNLTREQATLYQAVVDDMLGKIDDSEGMERKGLVLSTITKLKQICNHPTHFLKDRSKLDCRSGKLQRLE